MLPAPRFIEASANLSLTRVHLRGLRARAKALASNDEDLIQEVQKAEAAVASANAVSKLMSSAPHSEELLRKFEPLIQTAKQVLSEARQTFSRRPKPAGDSANTALMADLGAKLAATKLRLQAVQGRNQKAGSPKDEISEQVESASSTMVAAETIQYLAESDGADDALIADYDDAVTAAVDMVDRAARSVGRRALTAARKLASLEVQLMGVQTKLKTFNNNAPVANSVKVGMLPLLPLPPPLRPVGHLQVHLLTIAPVVCVSSGAGCHHRS